ncbi:MAG: 5'-nucleotidase [Candidatus Hydrogenedentes bacterium ADurb.Bin179]|nr:MAG: 5'-nucleotidase [Candidatus Hydrogenedentes bacterium ADurb.Bin179]
MNFRFFRSPDTTRPPLLLFDYDGVIADSLDILLPEFSRACKELGLNNINPEEFFLKLYDSNPVIQMIKKGFPLRKMRAMALEYAPKIEEIHQRIQPFPGIPETINRLGAKHPLFIITSNSSQLVRKFTETYGLGRVQGIMGVEEHISKVRKIRAARRLYPRHCPYYICDTKGDLVEARRARAVPVAVGWGWHDRERLEQGKPDFFVETQEQLCSLFGVDPP